MAPVLARSWRMSSATSPSLPTMTGRSMSWSPNVSLASFGTVWLIIAAAALQSCWGAAWVRSGARKPRAGHRRGLLENRVRWLDGRSLDWHVALASAALHAVDVDEPLDLPGRLPRPA